MVRKSKRHPLDAKAPECEECEVKMRGIYANVDMLGIYELSHWECPKCGETCPLASHDAGY